MTATAIERRQGAGNLYDVLDLILDKGLVVDAFVRVSLVGIELLTIDARIVIASVDTYLHFAEATDRLKLSARSEPQALPDLLSGDAMEDMSEAKTKGAIQGGVDRLRSAVGADRDDEAARE